MTRSRVIYVCSNFIDQVNHSNVFTHVLVLYIQYLVVLVTLTGNRQILDIIDWLVS